MRRSCPGLRRCSGSERRSTRSLRHTRARSCHSDSCRLLDMFRSRRPHLRCNRRSPRDNCTAPRSSSRLRRRAPRSRRSVVCRSRGRHRLAAVRAPWAGLTARYTGARPLTGDWRLTTPGTALELFAFGFTRFAIPGYEFFGRDDVVSGEHEVSRTSAGGSSGSAPSEGLQRLTSVA